MTNKMLFTSESVAEGHPDKVCDQISDAILDACLAQDPQSRVACETLVKKDLVVVAGEITTNANIDPKNIVRETLRKIGYTKPEYGIDADSCEILVKIDRQSPDIAMGVDGEETGAGDQGMMFGYACTDTPELMPLPITLSHKMMIRLAEARKNNELEYLRPDGKGQITVEYENGKPKRVDTVILSTQHDPNVPIEQLRKELKEKVIEPSCGEWTDENTRYLINPTGRFVIGGPEADAGVTGRKLVVDTYGGMGKLGGGALSGKDATKVDRSAAYAARYIAKNIVAAGLAEKCEVQLAYAIGVAEPVSIYVETFGTGPEEKLVEMIRKHFPLKPREIIAKFGLNKPIFSQTAVYGHFGRDFPWEKTDKAEEIKNHL